jgi:hypothetical protein
LVPSVVGHRADAGSALDAGRVTAVVAVTTARARRILRSTSRSSHRAPYSGDEVLILFSHGRPMECFQ